MKLVLCVFCKSFFCRMIDSLTKKHFSVLVLLKCAYEAYLLRICMLYFVKIIATQNTNYHADKNDSKSSSTF